MKKKFFYNLFYTIIVLYMVCMVSTEISFAETFDVLSDSHNLSENYDYGFPISSSIRFEGGGGSYCSGAVVGKDYVLTAGHCSNAKKIKMYYNGTYIYFGINKDESYYNSNHAGSFGDYGLVKVYSTDILGSRVRIGELKKPLTLWGDIESKKLVSKNPNTAIVGFPAGQEQRQVRNYITNITNMNGIGDRILGKFSGGGGGLSGSPLLNSQGQIIGVYHGSKSNDRTISTASLVDVDALISNTSIGNEDSRIYIWDDKETHTQKKKENNPAGDYIEQKNNTLVNMTQLFSLASENLKPGELLTGLTDGVRIFDNNSELKMPFGGLDLYPVLERTWGDVPWNFDETTGVLIFTGGGI